jgi:hypothetical protein
MNNKGKISSLFFWSSDYFFYHLAFFFIWSFTLSSFGIGPDDLFWLSRYGDLVVSRKIFGARLLLVWKNKIQFYWSKIIEVSWTKFETKTNVQPYFLKGQGLNYMNKVKVASTCKIYANMWGRSPHSGIACNGHWFSNVVFFGGAIIISTRPSCLDRMCMLRNCGVTPPDILIYFLLLSFFSLLSLISAPCFVKNIKVNRQLFLS